MSRPPVTAAEAARQLRRPEGELGLKIARNMNVDNRLIYEMTLDFLMLRPGDRILEIGMGNGFFIPQLFAKEPSLYYAGVDMSECMVEEAVSLNNAMIAAGSVSVHCSTADAIPYPDASFHKAFCVNVLYFWDQPARTLEEIRRVLRPGGELVLAIRSKDSMQQLPFVEYGFTLYDAASASALLEANGFSVDETITAMEPVKLSADGNLQVQLENICVRGIKK